MKKRFLKNNRTIFFVRDLKLPVRAQNALTLAKVETIEQLVRLDKSTLLEYRNLGVGSAQSIEKALAKRGLRLRREIK